MESIDFFHGTRVQPPLVIPFYDGKAELECTISEGWGQLIVHSLKCGAKYVRKLKRSIGMVYTEKDDLESLVSGSLGLKGIASLDAQISSKTGTELQLNRSEEIEDEFTFESPKCGERVIALYQFRRNINLKFRDNRLFHKKEWSMSTTYWADRIHDNSYMVSVIPECGCPSDNIEPDNGKIFVDMGNVTMTTDYIESGGSLKIPAFDLEIDKSALHKPVQFNRSKLPDYLQFLAGEIPEIVEAKFSLESVQIVNLDNNLLIDETSQKQLSIWRAEWERKYAEILAKAGAESERIQQEAHANAQRELIIAIAKGLEKTNETDINLNPPRYVIAMRFISALEDLIHHQADEKNLQELENSLKIWQEQFFPNHGE